MNRRDIIVIGASAGGVEALKHLVGVVEPTLRASVFIVLHLPSESRSYLPQILNGRKTLPVSHAQDGEAIQQGHIYVAPPDFHLVLSDGHIVLNHGPKENRHRPSIDALFRSAAKAYDGRVIGVILTGVLDDGVAGLRRIKSSGGVTIVQDPEEAAYDSLPLNALQNANIDYCTGINRIAALLQQLTEESMPRKKQAAAAEASRPRRKPSIFSCPECKGVLWEVEEGDLRTYRCRIGHRYSPQTLMAGQEEKIEDALWQAVTTLEESVDLCRKMVDRALHGQQQWMADYFNEKLEKAESSARVIREVLNRPDPALEDFVGQEDREKEAVAADEE